MNEWVKAASAAFATNGGADGYFTVVDSAPFYPGAFAWLSDTDAGSEKHVQITEVISATNKIGVRFVPDNEFAPNSPVGLMAPNYGRSNISAYTVAKSSSIAMPGQVVRVQQSFKAFPGF